MHESKTPPWRGFVCLRGDAGFGLWWKRRKPRGSQLPTTLKANPSPTLPLATPKGGSRAARLAAPDNPKSQPLPSPPLGCAKGREQSCRSGVSREATDQSGRRCVGNFSIASFAVYTAPTNKHQLLTPTPPPLPPHQHHPAAPARPHQPTVYRYPHRSPGAAAPDHGRLQPGR